MPSGLSELVGNLTKHCNLSKYFDSELLDLVKRKGVYPYDYMDSFARLSETSLPTREHFYSKLNEEQISQDDYDYALLVWDIFEM